METKRFMSDELKTLLKELAIRMVDAMGLWGSEEKPKGAEPTWAEKQHAMTEYFNSRDNMKILLGVIAKELSSIPETQTVVGLVTTKFIVATFHLLEEYMNIEFPEEEVTKEAENPDMASALQDLASGKLQEETEAKIAAEEKK